MPFYKELKKRWLILPPLVLILVVLNISMGSIRIPLRDVLTILSGNNASEAIWTEIIWNFRVTKALTCILAGSALSLSGLQMQTFFRNPLAGPDVLGLSSGASLMVSLLFFSKVGLSGPWALALTAAIGCSFVFVIVLLFASRLHDTASLLIVGLMIGATASSLVSVLQFTSKAEELQTFLIWTFGSVTGMNWSEIHVLAWVLLIGALFAIGSAKSLNAWLLGDNYAQSLGINLDRSRLMIILSTCILTGGVTAFCGPIVFVGLAVPHLTKLIIKTSNHKILIPNTMMAGAGLLLLCDIISRLPGTDVIFPLNAITALFGAPVVIWVIMRSKKISP
ncbi:MAG TPA: iron ABC transporter permease [Cyclobacteriaceae bacterium]|nr:iron ABC transporter permease [Cyclobacteriaceae bacterium]